MTATPGPRPVLVGAATVAALLIVYVASNPVRTDLYNHFVWQAAAWLEGQASIRFPIAATPTSPGNDYFQDVLPVLDSAGRATGRGLLPFPPLPALALLPFVAVFGFATPAQLIGALLGGLDMAVGFWALGRLPIRLATRVSTTLFVGLGTVFWYAAKLGTTWYLAHIVAFGLMVAAVGLVLTTRSGRDSPPGDGLDRAGAARRAGTTSLATAARRRLSSIDGRLLAAGLLFGLAGTARLPILLGAPFFLLAGGSRNVAGRTLSAGLGLAVPLVALLAYNQVSTGHLMSPAYDYLYRIEASGYPDLGYHPDWSIEDVRYIPDHLRLMLIGQPALMPACATPTLVRSPFGSACPIAMPDPIGMGLLLTSPAYLLSIPAVAGAVRSIRRLSPTDRAVLAGVMAAIPIAVFDLAHFSQGWVQFGYRFSLDYLPLLLPALAIGIDRVGPRTRLAVALIAVSIAINAWGVAWGGILGW